MINRLIIYHPIIFIIISSFAVLISFLLNLTISPFISNAVCFFLIITLGASHGAFDKFKGDKILNYFKINNPIIFYICYLSIVFSVILLWLYTPNILTATFLFLSIYHFGAEDLEYYFEEKPSMIENILRGAIIILTPLVLKTNLTLHLFSLINFNFPEGTNLFIVNNNILLNSILLMSIFYFILKIKNNSKKLLFIVESFAIISLYLLFSPFIAFTFYFCFLHSPRHYHNSISILQKKLDFDKISQINKNILFLTIATIFMFLAFFSFIITQYPFNQTIYITSIVGLASLTFPHIIVETINNKIEFSK